MKYVAALLMLLLTSKQVHSNEVFENYIQWIVNNSNLEYNNETLPGVRYVSADELLIIAYGSDSVQQAVDTGVELPNIIALYDHNHDTLIVRNTLDLDNWENHHIIVHELVHYLQDINGHYQLHEYRVCQQKLEKLAYTLHIKWMDEHNHPGQRPNALFLHMMFSNCTRLR